MNLDVFVAEIRRRNITIEGVALAPLLAQFIESRRGVSPQDIKLDMEWLHTASMLILWKSRSLLPATPAGSHCDSVEEIPDELLQRLAVDWAQTAQTLAGLQTRTGLVRGAAQDAPDEDPNPLTAFDLIQRATELAAWCDSRRAVHSVAPDTLSVDPDPASLNRMRVVLRSLLAAAGELLDVSPLFTPDTAADHRSGSFLAILEMARNREIEILQTESFGPIQLRNLSNTRTDTDDPA